LGCSSPEVKNESHTTESTSPVQAAELTSLKDFAIDGAIALPGMASRGVEPSMSLNDITGILDINVGRGFNIQLREEFQSIADLKNEWSMDPVWTYTVIEESDQHLLYSKRLPDGSMEQFHFMAVQGDDERKMVIRSSAMEEFEKSQAERMLISAQSFTWTNDLAQTK
jgi:hypothetical protein